MLRLVARAAQRRPISVVAPRIPVSSALKFVPSAAQFPTGSAATTIGRFRCLSTAKLGVVDFGGVTRDVMEPLRPDLVPQGFVSKFTGKGLDADGVEFSESVSDHLRWLAQKDSLRQGSCRVPSRRFRLLFEVFNAVSMTNLV